MKTIEAHRRYWARIAKQHGWYVQPFCIIAWIDEYGAVTDSVSYKRLDHDIVVFDTES